MFIDSFSKVPARLNRGVTLKRKLYLMSDDGTMLVTRLEDDLNLPFDKGAVMVRLSPRPCASCMKTHPVEWNYSCKQERVQKE